MNVTGDWNNDGKTDIGVTNGQQWYLDMNNNGAFDSGVDKAYNFGAPGWTPIVGDWNATGTHISESRTVSSGIWTGTGMEPLMVLIRHITSEHPAGPLLW